MAISQRIKRLGGLWGQACDQSYNAVRQDDIGGALNEADGIVS